MTENRFRIETILSLFFLVRGVIKLIAAFIIFMISLIGPVSAITRIKLGDGPRINNKMKSGKIDYRKVREEM